MTARHYSSLMPVRCDEGLPAFDLGADGGHEGLRRAANGDDAIRGKPSRHLRAFQHGVELAVHARHDLAGNALGADHAVPQIEIERRIALLAVGRDVRRRGEPLRRADRKPAQLAALDVGQHGRGAAGQELQVAGQKVGERRRRAAIGHVRGLDAGGIEEELGAEMHQPARPARAVGELAGLALAELDQLLERPGRQRGIDGEHGGLVGELADRHDVVQRIERRLVQDRIDRVAARDGEIGVAVGRLP